MDEDARGVPITAPNATALSHFNATIEAYLGFRNDIGERLKETLAAAPRFPMALCMRGYFILLLAARGLVPRAEAALVAAEDAARDLGATPRERTHFAALRAWCAGDLTTALQHWEAILAEHPRDVLALKLVHFWQFYLGESRALCESVARALPGWAPDTPGYGYVLGLHAFGLEESGDYAAAERTGRQAIALNPSDIWAAHAVAHVMEMQDRARDGVAWIDGLAAQFGPCNNFRFHLWWHRCLFHLELGQHDEVLARYDREVRAESTNDYLDICNAASLLWRLEDAGVAVGDRWAELARQAEARLDDHMLIFADAHYTMAVAAAGSAGADARMLESLRAYATGGRETEAKITAEVGTAVCDAIVAHRRGEFARVVDLLMPVRAAIRRLGGSHAQRDLFQKLLISAALADGRRAVARDLLAERRTKRPANRWAAGIQAQLGDG